MQSESGASEKQSVEFRPWSADDFRLQIPSNMWTEDVYEDGHGHAGSDQVQEFEEFNARFASMAENAAVRSNDGSIDVDGTSEADSNADPGHVSQSSDCAMCESNGSSFQNTTSYSTPMSPTHLVYTSGGVSFPVNEYRTSDGEEAMADSFSASGTNSMPPERCSWNSTSFNRRTNSPTTKYPSSSRTLLKQQLMRQQTLQQEEVRARRHQHKYHEAFQQQKRHQPDPQRLIQHQHEQLQQPQHHQLQPYQHQQQLITTKNFTATSNLAPINNHLPLPQRCANAEMKSYLQNPTDFHMVETCKRKISRPSNGTPGSVVISEGTSAPTGKLYPIPESRIVAKESQWGASDPGYIFNGRHWLRNENAPVTPPIASPKCTDVLRGYAVNGPAISARPMVRSRGSPSVKLGSRASPISEVSQPNTLSFASPGPLCPSVSSVSSNVSEVDDVLLQELINFERDENSNQSTSNINNHGNHASESFSDLLTFEGSTSAGKQRNSPEIPHIKHEPLPSGETHYHDCFVKDRKKKDTHNKIERSRRSHINDMIYELKDLLPQPGEAFFEKIYTKRQYKGHILSATVEYIKLMKGDLNALVNASLQKNAIEIKNKQLELRIQKLESCLDDKGISFEKTATPPVMLPHVIHSDVISSTTPANTSNSSVVFGHHQLQLPMVERSLSSEMPLPPADSTVGNGNLIPQIFNNPSDIDSLQFDFLQDCKMLPETSHMEDLMLNHFDPTIESLLRGLGDNDKEDGNMSMADNAFTEDFFSNVYSDLDLMEDDTESYCNDVMLSSPQLSSPNSSRHSLDDNLPMQPMDILS